MKDFILSTEEKSFREDASRLLAANLLPRRFYLIDHLIDQLPINPSGKVMKRELAAMAQELASA